MCQALYSMPGIITKVHVTQSLSLREFSAKMDEKSKNEMTTRTDNGHSRAQRQHSTFPLGTLSCPENGFRKEIISLNFPKL